MAIALFMLYVHIYPNIYVCSYTIINMHLWWLWCMVMWCYIDIKPRLKTYVKIKYEFRTCSCGIWDTVNSPNCGHFGAQASVLYLESVPYSVGGVKSHPIWVVIPVIMLFAGWPLKHLDSRVLRHLAICLQSLLAFHIGTCTVDSQSLLWIHRSLANYQGCSWILAM